MQLNNISPSSSCQSDFLPLTCPDQIGTLLPDALAVGCRAENELKGGDRISSPLQVANFGTDTIYINYHIAWEAMDRIFPLLEELKAWLQSGTDQEANVKYGNTSLFSFNLQRGGSKHYQYILKTGDITFLLSPRSHISTQPNACLQIGSISSQEGIRETVKAFRLWVHHHGGTIFQEAVSRIDICTDVKEDIRKTNIEDYEKHICRTSRCDLHTCDRQLSGVTVGRGNIMLRVYDKVLEMEQKKAFEKKLFFKRLWGGYDGPVTRVEFQLRREVIKDIFPKDSRFEVVMDKISELWKYLTCNWFRQASGKVDRVNKHQSRCEISKFWEIVQASASSGENKVTRNRRQIHIDIPALKKMVRGCMLTIAAGLGHAVEDFFGIMSTCRDILENEVREHMETAEYRKKFSVKQTAAFVSF